MRHFRALLQFDTSDPPGRELPAAEYLRDVLEAEGIEVEMLSNSPERPNVIARLKGDSSKEPLLIMAHTDVLTLIRKSGPSRRSARPSTGLCLWPGAVDDKDNLASALMVMLELKGRTCRWPESHLSGGIRKKALLSTGLSFWLKSISTK